METKVNSIQYGTENVPWGFWDSKKGLKLWKISIEKSIKRYIKNRI